MDGLYWQVCSQLDSARVTVEQCSASCANHQAKPAQHGCVTQGTGILISLPLHMLLSQRCSPGGASMNTCIGFIHDATWQQRQHDPA